MSATAPIKAEDWVLRLGINLGAPFLVAHSIDPWLETNHDSVVSMGSIRAQLTKLGFLVYASTKAVPAGMTPPWRWTSAPTCG